MGVGRSSCAAAEYWSAVKLHIDAGAFKPYVGAGRSVFFFITGGGAEALVSEHTLDRWGAQRGGQLPFVSEGSASLGHERIVVKDDDLTARRQGDHPVCLQPGELAADGLYCQTQHVGDLLA